MSKRLLLWLSLFAAALPAAANQTVRTYFTYDEFADDETKWTYGDTDGVMTSTGDVKPTNYTFQFGTGQQNDFAVHPANGWEIAAWHCAPHGSGYKKWQVQSGGNSYTWKADAQKDHTGWESLDLIAAFKPIDYKLSFEANGAAGSMADETHSFTNVFNLPPCDFTKSGAAFACWTNAATGATFADRALVSGEIFAVSNDNPKVTLSAVWTNCLYTLTFDANGGTFKDGSTNFNVLVSVGTPFHEAVGGPLPTPTWNGMARNGWWSEESGETEGTRITEDTVYTWTRDKTVYMHWVKATLFSVETIASPTEGGEVSGGGDYELDTRVTLSATPNEGYSFRDWSDGGAATHEIVVTSAATYTATFTGNVYSVSFDWWDDSVQGSLPSARSYVYGSPFGELPTAIPDDPGLQFVGWVDENDQEVTAEFKMQFRAKKNKLYAKTIARPFYTVAFVGGEKAEGEMPDQTIYRGEPTALTSNAFVRTGYTFAGWAEADDLAKVKYADGQVVTDIAAADATKELYAVWSANRFTVAFDGNDATEVAMDPQSFVYDVAQNLRPNTFARGELWSFDGWSNTVDGTVFEDGALVSNLCVTADGTNTLKAVWRSNLTDLSRAMHCDNLIWFSQQRAGTPWLPEFAPTAGYNPSGSEAIARTEHFIGDTANHTAYLSVTGTVRGTLSFYWKASNAGATLNLYCDKDGIESKDPVDSRIAEVADAWQRAEFAVAQPAGSKGFQIMKLELSDENTDTTVAIDQMTWSPGGGEPQQGDPVAPTAARVEGNVFLLTIPTSPATDYGVWTNADLSVPAADWGLWETNSATDATMDFSFEMLPGVPQLFFRAFKVK